MELYRGDSFTLGIKFNDEYNIERIQELELNIGSILCGKLSDDSIVKDANGVFVCKIPSEETMSFYGGKYKVTLHVQDEVLGVKKQEIGKIDVKSSNNITNNESINTLYDALFVVAINETQVTVEHTFRDIIKGDPLLFSDLTPMQIAELQRPATEAIVSIQAVELAVETAEGLRVQAELNRQTNTSTAISNAEQATDDANDAAILANEKAGLANEKALLADEKAGLAATATTQANAARDGANLAAGLADTARLNMQTALDGKQEKLVSGTNIKTVNGMSLLGSGDVNNLITTYTHTTNTVIQPTALDPATGLFTCNNHGLTQDKIVLWNLNRNHNLLPYQVIPIEINGGQYGNYYADVIDANSFKIKKTPTDAPLTYASAGDITKWHFETNAVQFVIITNLPAYKKLKVITKSISNSNIWFQLYPSNVGGQGNNWYIGGAVANAHAATNLLFGANMPAYIESYFDFGDISIIRHRLYGFTHVHTSPTTVTKVTPADLCWINFNNLGALTITDLMVGSPNRVLLNGTTVEIYKV